MQETYALLVFLSVTSLTSARAAFPPNDRAFERDSRRRCGLSLLLNNSAFHTHERVATYPCLSYIYQNTYYKRLIRCGHSSNCHNLRLRALLPTFPDQPRSHHHILSFGQARAMTAGEDDPKANKPRLLVYFGYCLHSYCWNNIASNQTLWSSLAGPDRCIPSSSSVSPWFSSSECCFWSTLHRSRSKPKAKPRT